jgi:hypothetical protein
MYESIPPEFRGWWRIVETSQWVNDGLDILGPALISLTGTAERFMMLGRLAAYGGEYALDLYHSFLQSTRASGKYSWRLDIMRVFITGVRCGSG